MSKLRKWRYVEDGGDSLCIYQCLSCHGQVQQGPSSRLVVLPTVRRALGRRTRMSSPCGPAVGLGPLWSPSALGIGLGQEGRRLPPPPSG